ncbi:hypothetical protein Pla22_38960 [Rubripirellula amarantea]|uniref:Secreted protein containing DUF1552 n=1 Tax=Rubripirellula amarantea TaxID=2527999 RepID=A0A5C5WLV7_9BACT|nr:DUF1552 domain-containing protein [Rubripirellula amarantea]TWT51119.1 hypothetical protein Pla22_38960 [Rubripirellula amarantea]
MFSRVDRRTFLRASGVSLALPMLESMSPAWASSASEPPKRMVFVCTALGLHPPHLWPTTPGENYESTPYLDLLSKHRQDFTLFSGLQHEDQTGRQPHDSEMTFLTAARKPGMSGFRNTISVDQVAANAIGNVTRFSSISLGSMKSQSQSYTSGGVMIPAETSPANMFAKLFLKGKPEEVIRQRQRLVDGQSILDGLGSETKRLKSKASASDNHLLDDYFESVRKAESMITDRQGWMTKPKPVVDTEGPSDVHDPADLIGRAQLLMDLVPLIVQSDSTRVISVMIQDHYVVPKVEGVTGNHHNLSHHGQDPSKIAQLEKIERGIVGCFDSLLSQLKAKSEQGSSLLDNTSVLFGSNLGNANAHHAKNVPVFLAGGGFQHGRYVAKKEGTPLCDLYVRMLNQSGIETESFGQSGGELSW